MINVSPKHDPVDPLMVHGTTSTEVGVVVYLGFVWLDFVGVPAYVDLTPSTLPLTVNINIIAATLEIVPAYDLQRLVSCLVYASPCSPGEIQRDCMGASVFKASAQDRRLKRYWKVRHQFGHQS